MYFLVFVLLIATCNGSSYEDNTTHVGVYANHISSCNLNHRTGNMLCINRDYESVIQYHDVSSATFCPYHYCVTFNGIPDKLACTGYVYLKMSGGMDEEINPLTPNKSNTKFTGNPEEDYIDIGYMFEGYNLLIDRFEQSVETIMDGPIVNVQCEEPETTCVSLGDGAVTCFGGVGLTYHDFVSSVMLGVIIPGAMSFVCYLLLANVNHKCAQNGCITKITVPVFVEVCCMFILFVASDFIVRVFPFLFSSILGIVAGNVLCEMVVNCFLSWKGRWSKRVDTENSLERSGMLRNSKKKKKKSAGGDFVIDEEDEDDVDGEGLTEIELGGVKST